MQTLSPGDLDWFTTFPHRVSPIADEWLPGLLLRCDEANGWGSGTTFRYLREHTQLERLASGPQLIVMPATLLERLAQLLLIPEKSLLPTTYHAELARLYDSPHPHGRHFSPQYTFHVCPACVAHTRLLTRTLVWPSLHYCPLHQIELRNRCQCGAVLWLFSGKTAPFTCVACGLDWGALPHRQIPRTRVQRERQLRSFYEYFLASGTPRGMEYATEILRQQQKDKSGLSWREHPKVIPYRKKFSLGYVVERLVSAGVSVQDIRPYWLESDSGK
jgi:TniQ